MSEWISVNERLPSCGHELNETGGCVSNVVMIHNANSYKFSLGFGHVNDKGEWAAYDGEHDFMNVVDVTHWQPLPSFPK